MENKNNSNKKFISTGVIAAFAASLCCIGPALALVAGVGGIASAFTWVEPLRPYLIGLTVIALGLAWYGELKPKKAIDCNCEEDEKKSFLQTKKFLGIVTVLSVILLTFPYYSSALTTSVNSEISATHEIVTADLEISGMTCEGCEANIENYSMHAGAESADADFKSGKAEIKFDESKTNIDSIKTSIESLGYKINNVKLK